LPGGLTTASTGCAEKRAPVKPGVEPVEKVTFDRIRSVGRKSDLSECSVYDDLMIGRGQETPENQPLIVVRGFFYRLVSVYIGEYKKYVYKGRNFK
jgi:hypothetical protein